MKVKLPVLRKNKRSVFGAAVGLNLLAMAVIVLVMRPSFETNDDIVFAEFGSGLRGVKDAHLVFQNYVLGLIYRFLYQATGRLPWYTIFQYAVLVAAFSAVSYVLINRMEGWIGLWLSLALLCCFGYETYIHIQFTKTGGIAAAAAVFLLFHVIVQEKFHIWEFLWGIGLGLLGFMYREDQFWASSALMAGIGIYFLLTLRKRFRNYAIRKIGVCAGVFAVLLISAGTAGTVDSFMYRSAGWQEYQEFNSLRSQLLDYGFPGYDSTEIYQELGITREAYELYRTWNFNDPDRFTSEVMEQLVQEKSGYTIRPEQALNFTKRIPRDLSKLAPVYYCGAFLAYWLIFGKKTRAAVLSLLGETVLLWAVYFYLYCQGRYMVNRVDVGLWFSVCLVVLWLISDSGDRQPHMDAVAGRTAPVLFVAVLIASQLLWIKDWRINTSSIPEARVSQRAVLETIGTDKDHVYLAKSGMVSEIVCYGPFDRMPENLLDNIYWFGGWECRTPGIVDKMREHGIENPYRDMINNESVYLIDDQIDLTMAYIHEYYDENAEAVFIKTLGNVDLYQIRSESRA